MSYKLFVRNSPLSHSRIQPVHNPSSKDNTDSLRAAFINITELHLGNSALTWGEAVDIASLFPSLETLFLNHNSGILDLSTRADQDVATSMSKLKVLSVDGCRVESWLEIVRGFAPLPA